MTTDWHDGIAKIEQSYDEDYLTFSDTNAQKVAFYKNIVDYLAAADKQYTEEYKSAYQKMYQAELAVDEQSYEQRVALEKEYLADFKQLLDQESSLVSTFVTDVLFKHKSLREDPQDRLGRRRKRLRADAQQDAARRVAEQPHKMDRAAARHGRWKSERT